MNVPNDIPATHDELLNATTPEKLAELMARAGTEAPPQGESAPAPAPAVDSAPAPAPTEGATPGTEPQPSGIATKSGAGVLPYRVLEQERDEKKQWRTRATEAQQEAETLRQQLTELSGRTAIPADLLDTARALTDQEVEDLKFYNPKVAAMVAKVRETAAPAAPTPAPAAPAPAPAVDEAAQDEQTAVNLALSQRPLLARLAGTKGPLWSEAIDLDAALRASPAWANKTHAEVFTEIERRIAAKHGIELAPAASTNPPPAAPSAPPVHDVRPTTLSDLQAGASPGAGDGISESANGMAMANKFLTMTEAQLAAVIRRAAT